MVFCPGDSMPAKPGNNSRELSRRCRARSRLSKIEASIDGYYTQKISAFGATPRGVDWSCAHTQELRHMKLLTLCDFSAPFSLNDIGCGYGALVGHLATHYADSEIDYLGIDISAAMIRRARRRWPRRDSVSFLVGSESPRIADYSVASGIFNVKLNHPVQMWTWYIARLLTQMHLTSRRGFAVNFIAPPMQCLASPSSLYRTKPDPWIRYCEHEFGSKTELIAGYGLHEFTLLVWQNGSRSHVQ